MPKRRRIEVTIEQEEFYVSGQPQNACLHWCEACAREVEMLRPEVAVTLTGVSARAIYRWAEAGLTHFVETPDGLLMVCLKSLTELLDASRRQIKGLDT